MACQPRNEFILRALFMQRMIKAARVCRTILLPQATRGPPSFDADDVIDINDWAHPMPSARIYAARLQYALHWLSIAASFR